MTSSPDRTRSGLMLGFTAYFLWGLLPLYFKALARVLPTEIVAHRVLWSLILLAILLGISRRWAHLRRALSSPRLIATLAASAGLIGINWLVYIWAVVNGHVLEGSLGYYLNPLVNVLLGVLLLRERLSRWQAIAVFMAAAAVTFLAVEAGAGIWISLTLAASFALYGFVRKVAPVDALEGLTVETLLLAPIALAWLLWLGRNGQGSLGGDGLTDALLVISGAVTATPLLLFTAAAKRLPYSTLGFLQYVAPSIQFLLAVLAFGEPLSRIHLFCFAVIWTALVIFGVDGVRTMRAAAGKARAGATFTPSID